MIMIMILAIIDLLCFFFHSVQTLFSNFVLSRKDNCRLCRLYQIEFDHIKRQLKYIKSSAHYSCSTTKNPPLSSRSVSLLLVSRSSCHHLSLRFILLCTLDSDALLKIRRSKKRDENKKLTRKCFLCWQNHVKLMCERERKKKKSII